MEKRITLPDLNPPAIVSANTYRWSSGGTADSRRRNEKNKLGQVYDWLLTLNERFGLGMSLTCDSNIKGTVVDEKGKVKRIVYFHYAESCHHVYKKQDFRKLLKLIKTKI